MEERAMLQVLALERCRMHVSHIGAIHHFGAAKEDVSHILAAINKELELLEAVFTEVP